MYRKIIDVFKNVINKSTKVGRSSRIGKYFNFMAGSSRGHYSLEYPSSISMKPEVDVARNPIFEAGIKIILSAAASLSIRILYADTVPQEARDFVERFINMPNIAKSGKVFLNEGIRRLLMKKSVYLYWNGSYKDPNFYWLNTDEVTEHTCEYGVVMEYEYRGRKIPSIYSLDQFDTEMIWQIESLSPLSLVDAAKSAVELYENKLYAYNIEAQSDAMVQFQTKSSSGSFGASPDIAKQAEEFRRSRLENARRNGQPTLFISPAGNELERFSSVNSDLSSIFATAKHILFIMGIPPVLAFEKGDVGHNTMRNTYQFFLNNNVHPMINYLLSQLSHNFSVLFNLKEGDIAFETDPTSELWRPERMAEVASKIEAVSFMSQDEKRLACGLPALSSE